MVPAAYLVIKRRARQKKKHEEAFLGYEADDEDNDNEGVSFGRCKARRTNEDKEDKESLDTGEPQKIKEEDLEENKEWERPGEPEKTKERDDIGGDMNEKVCSLEMIKESDVEDMEEEWERIGDTETTKEKDTEDMEEEWERTGELDKTKERNDIGGRLA